jgi:hypothetical protein
LNIPKDDYRLRTDASWYFSSQGIFINYSITFGGLTEADFIFFPEVEKSFDSLQSKNKLHVILVDHNKLAEKQRQLHFHPIN